MVDRNELWAEAEELADLLIQAPEFSRYQQAEKAMQKNKTALAMIAELKDLQEQIGEFQARKVPEAYYQNLTNQSESLLEQLEKIDEVREFQSAQDAVNELLKAVTDRLSLAVSTRVLSSESPPLES